ncbi:hypothetical protein LTS17_008697 [Exophiala oligosperma]
MPAHSNFNTPGDSEQLLESLGPQVNFVQSAKFPDKNALDLEPGSLSAQNMDDVFFNISTSSEPSATDHNLTLFADHMYSAYGIKHYHGGVEMADYLAEVDAAAISVENHDTANETPESQRVAAAYQKLSELSNASTVAVSQPPTPRVTIEHQQWIASLIVQPLPRFDRDITNVFIHLFEDNVCGAFPIFRGFRITRDTPQHLYLAMAAVGGLYCATAGSLRMATWYIQNARRHLFTIVYHFKFMGARNILPIIMTYALLELFGYVSGEPRSFELIDVWHFEMLQLLRGHGLWQENEEIAEVERDKLMQCVYILESYRVTVLHRPPLFYSSGDSASLPFIAPSCLTGPVDLKKSRRLQSMASLSGSLDRQSSISTSLATLCSIISSAAQAMLRDVPGPAPDHHVRAADEEAAASSTIGTVFFEMLLNTWRSTQTVDLTPGLSLLFHMAHLNLYVCLPALQDKVQQKIYESARAGLVDDAHHTETVPAPLHTNRQFFRNTDGRVKARWHALQILQTSEDMVYNVKNLDGTWPRKTSSGRRSNDDGCGISLVPHFAYSVFAATICLWYSDDVAHNPSVSADWTELLSCSATYLQVGQALLRQATSNIAHVYWKILDELGSASPPETQKS